jgi:hypothetical protein
MKTLLAVMFAFFALIAHAADVAGTWKANFETPNGNIESTFVFKVDAGKLTGTVTSGNFGEVQIVDGKVDGDNVTFSTVRNGPQGEFRINYKGKMAGDEIKFEVSFTGMDQTFPITAKRAK